GQGGPLDLDIRGFDPAQNERIRRSVHSHFVAGQTRSLSIFLAQSCLDRPACDSGSTCIDGACASSDLEPGSIDHRGGELPDGAMLPNDGAGEPPDKVRLLWPPNGYQTGSVHAPSVDSGSPLR